ncbi:hypothetical protein SAMN05428642_101693 [Flaviramulus basaltis]|uniref:Uncharacterized protein n=1 Tax=Flaviramulus basaltis TaxID=369401 RepID=A0A1K2IC91_9FLAO|nr:hypothetical protein [Flaviramulus basaltis]SFZ90015.1 hypothetical protein SAMN05428642_101693 [Flaviramulus basaltis]
MRKLLSILTISIMFMSISTNGLQIKESYEESTDVIGCVRAADYMAVTLATLGGLG